MVQRQPLGVGVITVANSRVPWAYEVKCETSRKKKKSVVRVSFAPFVLLFSIFSFRRMETQGWDSLRLWWG